MGMIGSGAGDDAAVYELTVAGGLGAVFRSAVRPHEVARSEICTILRAGTTQDRDLVDLVFLLQSHGLSVEGVFSIEEGLPNEALTGLTAAVPRPVTRKVMPDG